MLKIDKNYSFKGEEMKGLLFSMAAVPLLVCGFSVDASASTENGVNILSDSKFTAQIRPRYEMADKEGGADAANAYTTRVRLAVEAKLLEIEGLSAKVGLTSVNNFGSTNYAPANTSTKKSYDTILDEQQAILSEGYLSYKKYNTTLIAGRSFINLDDQRFIGTVGWRQMERAYDTVTVVNNSVENLTLLGSYIYGYQGVNSAPTTETNSIALNINYKADDALNISTFSYLLADIHDTYGLRLTGKLPIDAIKLNYAASYAVQSKATMDDSSAKNAKIDASYYDLALNANIDGIIFGVEYEVLGKAKGSSTKGFTTPLATLHKFQGFADEFLGQTAGSNNNGLIDTSAKLGYTNKNFGKALVLYHDFTAQTGDATDLGSEIDALYVNKVPGVNSLKFLLKAAFFQAGETNSGHTSDNTKYWAQLDYKF